MNLGVPSKHRSPSGDILAVGRRPRTRVDASAPRGALVVLGLLLATLLPASALAPAASAVTLSTSLSGATAPVAVSGAPSGPPAPSGGWKVAYADGFGASLGNGAGQDNTWKLDQRDQGCCNNGNEINAERPEMVSVGSEGLNLRCERREVVSKPYVCGGISGYSGTDPTGYRTPKIEFKGQTMALEFTAKLPPAHGIADPGMWMNGSPWTDVEFDSPEAWGYGSSCKVGWEGCSMGFIWFSPPHPEIRIPTSNALAEGLHKYTTHVWPTGNGRYCYSVYLDGALKGT